MTNTVELHIETTIDQTPRVAEVLVAHLDDESITWDDHQQAWLVSAPASVAVDLVLVLMGEELVTCCERVAA